MKPPDAPNPLSQTPARAGVFLSRYAPTEQSIAYLAGVLRNGGLVAVPSETVYGLAADATNPDACRAIFELKRRPFFDPLIVHVADMHQARQYAEFSPLAEHLATTFWPGALTLVLPRKTLVPDIVTSGGPTVALRSPAHTALRALLKKVGRGLAAPSANPFGYISPTTAEHVEHSFGKELAHILDGGACPIGVESTIVDVSSRDRIVILRHGGIPRQAIESALAKFSPTARLEEQAEPDHAPNETQPAQAPGLLKRHYSPHKRLQLFPHGKLPHPNERPRVAYLAYEASSSDNQDTNVFALTNSGDSHEAAARLYAILRELDEAHWTEIFVELPRPGSALAEAIIDRLERAASQE